MDAKTRDINFKINKKTYNNTVTHTRRKRKKKQKKCDVRGLGYSEICITIKKSTHLTLEI